MEHLHEVPPFGIEIDARPRPTGDGLAAVTTGPADEVAPAARSEVCGAKLPLAGSSWSIGIVSATGDASTWRG